MASVSRRGGSNRRMVNEINVVPYIDVMLVLLVIFMVTAPLLSPGVIDLPTVGSSSVKKDRFVEVQIPSLGDMLVQTKNEDGTKTEIAVSADTLVPTVRDLTGNDPLVPIVISADKAVIYENVMSVMNQLKKMGAQKVGLLVKKPN
ncbi:MAG: biopolymer transporter ExbD [Burkholderiaceae bacterium]